jgi:hypothetical protein
VALTLECVCGPDVSLCNLIDLTWIMDVSVGQVGTIGATGFLDLDPGGGGGPGMSGFGAGHYEFSLSPTLFTDPTASLRVDASLFQTTPGEHFTISVADYIRQRYNCINAMTGDTRTKVVNAVGTAASTTHCQTGPDTRSICTGLTGTLFKSTPLGDCNGCTATLGLYRPKPILDVAFNPDNSGSLCLCATGGSGDYSYSIVSGNLPCGQSLNPTTGCIEGTPDGSCDGTTSITFRVTDAGGADISSTTGGDTIGGSCRTFGTGVTRISGGAFTADMVGHSIIIGSTPYTVASVTPPDTMVISASAGIVDPAPWSYTSPIVTAPTPGPPATAEVTCGYLFACLAGPGLGNWAF